MQLLQGFVLNISNLSIYEVVYIIIIIITISIILINGQG